MAITGKDLTSDPAMISWFDNLPADSIPKRAITYNPSLMKVYERELMRPWDSPYANYHGVTSWPIGGFGGDLFNYPQPPGAYKPVNAPPPDAFWPNAQNRLNSIASIPGVRDRTGKPLTSMPTGGLYYVPVESLSSVADSGWNHNGDNGLGLGGIGSLALGIGGNMLLPGLGSALGGGLLGAAGAGAIIGGGTAALTGGNVLKGAALGGLGAGVGNYVGSNFSTNPASGFAGISPAQLASTVGKTSIGMLSGASPSQALTSGLASLAGTSAASNFDNPWLKSISGSLASTAVRGGDLGQAAILGGIGGLSQNLASNVDNKALQSLIRQSPGMLNSIMMSAGNNSQRYVPRQPVQNKPPAWVSQAMVALGKKGYSEQQAKQMIQQRGRG